LKTNGSFLLSQIRNLSARAWDRLLRDSGVAIFNGAQGRILYVLWENGTMNITEIGKLTSLAKTTLTSMLDRMESQGLIEKIQDKNNRRQTLVTVTEKARIYEKTYEWLSQKLNGIMYQGFTNMEIMAVEIQLKRMVTNLEKDGRGEKA
jgi:DNA-binding MarR family transcriptional regulator